MKAVPHTIILTIVIEDNFEVEIPICQLTLLVEKVKTRIFENFPKIV